MINILWFLAISAVTYVFVGSLANYCDGREFWFWRRD